MKKVIIASVAVAVLTLACGEEEGVTPRVPDRLEPTTPANVLKNVAISFNQRDVILLKAMLSPDFVFYFDPRDVGQSPPGRPSYRIPESWSYAEFWPALKNMFDKAYSINLSIPTSRVGTPGENETTYKANNINISLLVMVDELNGFIVDPGYCNFEFDKYTTKESKKYWRLTGWWDRTSQGYDEYPAPSPSSLGRVLAMYY
ncbi:MAG: hypothetical protein V3W11_07615 [bacterium]